MPSRQPGLLKHKPLPAAQWPPVPGSSRRQLVTLGLIKILGPTTMTFGLDTMTFGLDTMKVTLLCRFPSNPYMLTGVLEIIYLQRGLAFWVSPWPRYGEGQAFPACGRPIRARTSQGWQLMTDSCSATVCGRGTHIGDRNSEEV